MKAPSQLPPQAKQRNGTRINQKIRQTLTSPVKSNNGSDIDWYCANKVVYDSSDHWGVLTQMHGR